MGTSQLPTNKNVILMHIALSLILLHRARVIRIAPNTKRRNMTSIEQAIELVKRYADRRRTRNLIDLDEFFTEDFINHSAEGAQYGLDKFKEFVSEARRWMPDIEVIINSIFANEGKDGEPWVGAFVTLRGTTAHDNKALEMQEVWIFQFRDNKISERRYVYDEAAKPM